MTDVTQYVELWGSVQYADRPENHRKVTINDRETTVHSVAVKSNRDGKTVYVSFFEDSFPNFQHPEQGQPVFITGSLRPSKDQKYTNVTATGIGLMPFTRGKRRQDI